MFEQTAGWCAISGPMAISVHAGPTGHDRRLQSGPSNPSEHIHVCVFSLHKPFPEQRLGQGREFTCGKSNERNRRHVFFTSMLYNKFANKVQVVLIALLSFCFTPSEMIMILWL
jgi:hypothetical protein